MSNSICSEGQENPFSNESLSFYERVETVVNQKRTSQYSDLFTTFNRHYSYTFKDYVDFSNLLREMILLQSQWQKNSFYTATPSIYLFLKNNLSISFYHHDIQAILKNNNSSLANQNRITNSAFQLTSSISRRVRDRINNICNNLTKIHFTELKPEYCIPLDSFPECLFYFLYLDGRIYEKEVSNASSSSTLPKRKNPESLTAYKNALSLVYENFPLPTYEEIMSLDLKTAETQPYTLFNTVVHALKLDTLFQYTPLETIYFYKKKYCSDMFLDKLTLFRPLPYSSAIKLPDFIINSVFSGKFIETILTSQNSLIALYCFDILFLQGITVYTHMNSTESPLQSISNVIENCQKNTLKWISKDLPDSSLPNTETESMPKLMLSYLQKLYDNPFYKSTYLYSNKPLSSDIFNELFPSLISNDVKPKDSKTKSKDLMQYDTFNKILQERLMKNTLDY